jgi:transcriptional regulator with XRE-family HTH domain
MRHATGPSAHGHQHAYAARGHTFSARQIPGADPELARLFTELRQFLGLSIAAVAHQLGSHPNTIAALEAGRIDLLPPWSETARVVAGYIGLARLDPRPALDRLAMLMGVIVTAPAAVRPPFQARMPAAAEPRPAVQHADPITPVARILGRLSQAAARTRSWDDEPGVLAEWGHTLRETVTGLARTVRGLRAPVRWVMAVAVGLAVIGSATPSGVLQASVHGFSDPFSGLWRSLSGTAGQVRVQIRNGLKWIEADDPRARRSDKLPSRGT